MDGTKTGQADSLWEKHYTSLFSYVPYVRSLRVCRCVGRRTGLRQGGALAMENVCLSRGLIPSGC